MKRTPSRGVKQTLNPSAYKRSDCIMNLRVTLAGEVKRHEPRSRSESESEEGVESAGVDAKPGDLPLARMKSG